MHKILVVDDDQDLRENLVEVLTGAGFLPIQLRMATEP